MYMHMHDLVTAHSDMHMHDLVTCQHTTTLHPHRLTVLCNCAFTLLNWRCTSTWMFIASKYEHRHIHAQKSPKIRHIHATWSVYALSAENKNTHAFAHTCVASDSTGILKRYAFTSNACLHTHAYLYRHVCKYMCAHTHPCCL